MPPRAQWTRRFLPRSVSSFSSPAQHRSSSRAVENSRLPTRKRSRSLPPLSVVVGAGIAGFLLTSSPEHARRLRSTAQLGMMVFHENDAVLSLDDAMVLAREMAQILRHGGLQAVQDELVERLLTIILQLQDDAESLRYLIHALPLLVEYAAWMKPTDPQRLQQLVRSFITLLKAAADNGQVELRVPLMTLAPVLQHFAQQQDDAVSFLELLQLGDALMEVQLLARQRLEEGADASRVFVVHRTEVEDPESTTAADACKALVALCSSEMPLSIRRFGLWALGALIQSVNRENASALQAQQLETALGSEFAETLLALPRKACHADLQLQAATVLDSLLHVARQNPAMVSRDTYELWMQQIQYWARIQSTDQTMKPTKTGWRWQSFRNNNEQEGVRINAQNTQIYLQLQLTSARCLRTLTASPQSRRYVCESERTRAALFQLSRQVHERKQQMGGEVTMDSMRSMVDIQRHVSWTFRNICTGFHNGAVALNCLFDATWTASLLQSRRDLPMSRFFRGLSDLTDLPIIGAEDYDSSTEFGWVDILTAWSASPDHQVRENGIASLIHLAEQQEAFPAELSLKDEGIRSKQEHILQAWLANMLQQMRLLSGGELLAVKQMEEIAHVSKELTPGNERILFNPAVVDAGTSALAVLAEHHHAELVRQGVVSLMALLSATSAATPAQRTQCARVLANLVATYCLDIDPSSSALNSEPTRGAIANDHVDIARLLGQTASGKRYLASIRRWGECKDPMQRSNYFRVAQNLRAYDEVVADGRLTEDVYCEGVNPIVPQTNSEVVNQASDDNNAAPMVDIVFVHGLRGHPFGTWRTDMSSKLKGNNNVWPDILLAKDLQDNHVPARLVTLGYEAGMVSWSSPWPSLTLQERARVMLSALYAANIGRDRNHPDRPARPVVFITHSMGGLLTKKMLLLEHEQRQRFKTPTLADNTAGVVFLAVPHFGSDLANGVRSESVRKLIQTHPAIQDLGADPNGRLKTLNDSFKELGIDCLSVGEELAAPVALGLSAVVVKPDSADPRIGRFYVLPSSDHMTICKAKSRDEPLYQDILQYVMQRTALHAAR